MLKHIVGLFKRRKENRLAWRLLASILLFSSVVTLITSFYILFTDYNRDMSYIDDHLDQIQGGYVDSLSYSLWNFDFEQIQNQLKGILNYQEIYYVYIHTPSGQFFEQGQKAHSSFSQTTEILLNHIHEGQSHSLGKLYLQLNYQSIYDELASKAMNILLTQFIKTFIVSLFILVIFRYLVTRHLTTMAEYARDFDLQHLDSALDLQRPVRGEDELDAVVNAINRMRESLAEDIRRRQIAETGLRNSENRLTLALEAGNLGIFEYNIDDDSSFINQHMAAHLGYQRDLVIRKRAPIEWWFEQILPEQRYALKEDYQRLLQGKIPSLAHEVKARHVNGEEKTLEVMATPVIDHDSHDVIGVVGCQLDVSEKIANHQKIIELNQSLEQKVQQRTKELTTTNQDLQSTLEQLSKAIQELRTTQDRLVLSEKMAALGGLVAGVAHEMNTPLGICMTSISGLHQAASEMDSKLHAGQLTKQQLTDFNQNILQYSELTLKNLERASQIINTFKEVAVDQSGENKSEFNLGEHFNNIKNVLESRLDQGVTLKITCPDNLLITSYPMALARIVNNLVDNSLAHAFNDSNDNNQINIEIVQENKFINLIYEDNGKGIDKEVQGKVFEAFFTTMRNQGGLGLGLHITYNLVTQLLNGTIEVESTNRIGTRFTIIFPADTHRQILDNLNNSLIE